MGTDDPSNPLIRRAEAPATPSPWWKAWLTRDNVIKLIVFLLLVAVILVAFLGFDVQEQLGTFLAWLQNNKEIGFFTFVAVYALCTVLFVPGLILSLGAGFIFKIPLGTLAVWVGATIGQTCAFLLGRCALRDWIANRTRHVRVWQGIEAAIEEEGWKIVGLLRLAPLIPYNILNYALGLTAVKFWAYFFASAVGILPGTVLYVSLGSVAGDITKITSGTEGANKTTYIVSSVITVVIVVIVIVLTTYYAKRAIRSRLDGAKSNEDVDVEDNDRPVSPNSAEPSLATGELSTANETH